MSSEAARGSVVKVGPAWGWYCSCGSTSDKAMTWAVAMTAMGQHLAGKHGPDRDVAPEPERSPAPRQRYRCTVVGCNPELYGEAAEAQHHHETGHRTAKWPVRSAEGKRRERKRNRSGYHRRYQRGVLGRWSGGFEGDGFGSAEALGQS